MNQMPPSASLASAFRAGIAYLVIIASGNLVWEIAHAPLYTLWVEASFNEAAFAIMHCTIGDVAIAAVSLTIAWALLYICFCVPFSLLLFFVN